MENQGARRRVEELDAILESRDGELNRLRNERETGNAELEAKIDELTGFLAEREGEIRGLKLQNLVAGEEHARIAELEVVLGQRDHRIGELESFLRERDYQIDGLRFEKEGLAFQLRERDSEIKSLRNALNSHHHLESRISELEWLLGERDGELHRLRSERGGREHKLASRIGELEWYLGERDAEIIGLHYEKGNLCEQLDCRNADLDFLRHELGKLAARDSRISELEWLLGERDAALDSLRGEQGELRHQFDARNAELESLRREVVTGESSAARIQELEWLLGERDGELDDLRRAKGDAADKIRHLEELITGKETQLAGMSELEALLGQKDRDLDSLRSKNDELNSLLESREEKLTALQSERSAREEFEARVRELEWILGERDRELKLLRNEFTDQEALGGKAKKLKTRPGDRDREILELKSSRKSEVTLDGVFEGENVTSDEQLGVLYPEPPEQVDDLKRINGIAKVLEKKLHDIGIYRFKQIAVWTHDQVIEFGERLSFRDRIYRDQWIPQALDLHRREYGESLPHRVDLYHKPAAAPKKEKKPASGGRKSVAINPQRAFAGEAVKMDRLLGPIFNSRPREVDDLAKISGLSGEFAAMLNNFGIYRYKQVALWNPPHLKEFRLLLNVNGHTDLESWVVEAGEKHLEKYGEQIGEK